MIHKVTNIKLNLFELVKTNLKNCFVFLCFIVSIASYSQNKPNDADYKAAINRLVQDSPKDYERIHTALQGSENDTLRLHYLLKYSKQHNFKFGQAYALYALGKIYTNSTQYLKAITHHKKALKLAKEINFLELRIACLNSLGLTYRQMSSIKQAMDYSSKALSLAKSSQNPTKTILYNLNQAQNGIGNIYQQLQQYDRAIKQYEKSVQLEIKQGNKLGQAINYHNIGECKELTKQFDEALRYYKKSLLLNEAIACYPNLVKCKTAIARILIKQGQAKEAIALLEAAENTSKKFSDQYVIAPVYINKGWAKMLLKQYNQAEKNILKGLNISKKHHLIRSTINASNLLSTLYQSKNEFEKALDYKLKAFKLKDDILNANTIGYINNQISKNDSEKKSIEIKLLAEQNESTQLELRKNKTIVLIISLAIALFAFILYILYRQNQLKNEKKLLTLEQNMLRSQMNPHFLFNSLNSIKLYIINNDKKNAVHYLNKFSKLVRKILEASSVREISLADELETIALYMKIENIRFSNEIDFQIIIDKAIDPHNIKIPSFILQPFLENSLWHGLSSKKGQKKIRLNINKMNREYVQISILDNGIGRKASEEIKRNKVLKKKSVGLDITRDRLSNFSRGYQNYFKLDIFDCYKEDNTVNGTKVVLQIPII